MLPQAIISAAIHRVAWEKYPTRTVEHMLAWMVVVWSFAVAWPGNMMVGPSFAALLVIAPEQFWGWSGVVLGVLRLIALYVNGRWRRTPGLRLLGAASGMIWWIVLSACYWVAVENGAPDFPMRYVFYVFIAFEVYSCFRCGQDRFSPMTRNIDNGK